MLKTTGSSENGGLIFKKVKSDAIFEKNDLGAEFFFLDGNNQRLLECH